MLALLFVLFLLFAGGFVLLAVTMFVLLAAAILIAALSAFALLRVFVAIVVSLSSRPRSRDGWQSSS